MTTSQDTSLAELQADLAELETEFAELAGSGVEASSQADMLTTLSADGDPEVNALVFGMREPAEDPDGTEGQRDVAHLNVGHDGIAFADYCEPPSTTVRQPREAMGGPPSSGCCG